MSPAVVNGNGTPSDLPEEVSKPPEGVVLPPRDIRSKIPFDALLYMRRMR